MALLHSIFSHYYLIPAGTALLIVSRKVMAGFAAAFGALALWTSFRENGSHAVHLAHALLVALTIIGGLFSGIRARAILLALPRRKRNVLVTIAAVTAGFSMLPGLKAEEVVDAAQDATLKLRKWEMRAPSAACMARKYPVMVAGSTFYLPPAPVITIREKRRSYHFQFNNEVRALCARDAREPVHAQNLNFDFTIPARTPFCQATRSRWGRSLCSQKTESASRELPDMANLYSPGEYDTQRILAGYSYADFVAEREKAKNESHPLESQQAGNLDRYANGYWVARPGTWKNDAGEPFTMKCEESAQPGALSCTTSYRLKTGPQLTYHFSAPANKLEAVSRKLDRNFHTIIAEVSAP